MDFSAADIAQYDQQVAALNEVLDATIEEFKAAVEVDGETSSAVYLARVLMLIDAPITVINLLTVAIARLAR